MENNRHLILATLLFIFLTVIVSWNVLANLDSVIVGRDIDVFINPWADWWTHKALSDPAISLWQTNFMFYPNGANLSFHSFSHLNTLVSLSLRPLVGVLPAYNLTILLNYVLAGISMYQLARYLTGSAVAGILAGIIFAFNSHSLFQSSHPVLVSIWCFPWLTLSLLRAVKGNSLKWAVMAGLFLGLGAFSSTLLLILMGIWLILLLFFLFISNDWPNPPLRVLIVFGLFSLVLIIPLLFPLIKDAIGNRDTSFVITKTTSIASDMFGIFIPPWFMMYRRDLYMGIVPFYFILVAVGQKWREVRFWFLIMVGAYLFSIGPRPTFLGREIDILLPWSLLVTPLVRNTHRLNILLSLGLAIVVAYGWVGFTELSKRQVVRYAGAFFAIVLIFVDLAVGPFPSLPVDISTFYTEFLPDSPEDVVIANLPTGRQQDKAYMFYQTYHHRRMTGGVISRHTDDVYDYILNNELLRAGAVDYPETELPENVTRSLEELDGSGVNYVVLDKRLMDVEPWRRIFPNMPIFEDQDVLVYSTDAG